MADEISTSVHFWTHIEEKLSLKVPTYIKNIVTLYGYTNAAVIRTIDDKVITELEDFAKQEMIFLLPDGCDKKDYYHIFHEKINDFKFIGGHKALLKQVVDFVNNQIIDKGIEEGLNIFRIVSTTVKSGLKTKETDRNASTSTSAENSKVNSDSIKLIEQVDLLYSMIKSSIKKKAYPPDVCILIYLHTCCLEWERYR